MAIMKVESYGTDEQTKKVIVALKNLEHKRRSIEGLAKETGLSKDKVSKALLWLSANKLGVMLEREKGISRFFQRETWSLTPKGIKVFEQVRGSE